ncbi:hypothetical protein IE81DRAFT_73512 [Ceraceosorus guamensis]|uniref:Uncharacterized protein n=1 Tax=Ceraceosorus guamensis TaxID=1522189 RepID=A0A316W1V9_9BASI|nr:hypothetical protein IE81DRAFT_73512 [Ceraceosorus guamensis]PWN43659.1 hypothetical protein IE81DRAFT_73512 [Ceraceosorus guamensis]
MLLVLSLASHGAKSWCGSASPFYSKRSSSSLRRSTALCWLLFSPQSLSTRGIGEQRQTTKAQIRSRKFCNFRSRVARRLVVPVERANVARKVRGRAESQEEFFPPLKIRRARDKAARRKAFSRQAASSHISNLQRRAWTAEAA